MINKIIEIRNVGRFTKYKIKPEENWNGQFSKVNVIYAPNGSGKTTLSLILKSLKLNDSSLIEYKKTFNSTSDQYISIKTSENERPIEFKNSVWNKNLFKIEIFDVHFVEDYLFLGSLMRKQTKTNLFNLVLDNEGGQHKNKCRSLIVKQDNLKKKLKNASLDQKIIIKESIKKNSLILDPLLKEFDNYSKSIFEKYITTTNKYLVKYASHINLKSFSYLENTSQTELFRIFLEFEVYGVSVKFLAPEIGKRNPNAKFSLSEGDKNAIAIAFFLAHIEIKGINNKIIVFDDPLSSFDYSRKNITLHNLAKIASECEQFFLLSHDLLFAKDFTEKIGSETPLNLIIDNDGSTSKFKIQNIEKETLTSLQLDILRVKSFLKNQSNEENEKREIVRCIRPILEGAIKIKFFEFIPNNKWLGDIISLINNSKSNEVLYKLNKIKDELSELNDYSKRYHHLNSSAQNEVINPIELKTYLEQLVKILYEI